MPINYNNAMNGLADPALYNILLPQTSFTQLRADKQQDMGYVNGLAKLKEAEVRQKLAYESQLNKALEVQTDKDYLSPDKKRIQGELNLKRDLIAQKINKEYGGDFQRYMNYEGNQDLANLKRDLDSSNAIKDAEQNKSNYALYNNDLKEGKTPLLTIWADKDGAKHVGTIEENKIAYLEGKTNQLNYRGGYDNKTNLSSEFAKSYNPYDPNSQYYLDPAQRKVKVQDAVQYQTDKGKSEEASLQSIYLTEKQQGTKESSVEPYIKDDGTIGYKINDENTKNHVWGYNADAVQKMEEQRRQDALNNAKLEQQKLKDAQDARDKNIDNNRQERELQYKISKAQNNKNLINPHENDFIEAMGNPSSSRYYGSNQIITTISPNTNAMQVALGYAKNEDNPRMFRGGYFPNNKAGGTAYKGSVLGKVVGLGNVVGITTAKENQKTKQTEAKTKFYVSHTIKIDKQEAKRLGVVDEEGNYVDKYSGSIRKVEGKTEAEEYYQATYYAPIPNILDTEFANRYNNESKRASGIIYDQETE